MEEGQRERELVYEEMVRKYLIIVYLYLDTLFILFIIVTRNETILYKNNIFNIATTFSTILYIIFIYIIYKYFQSETVDINFSLLLKVPKL